MGSITLNTLNIHEGHEGALKTEQDDLRKKMMYVIICVFTGIQYHLTVPFLMHYYLVGNPHLAWLILLLRARSLENMQFHLADHLYLLSSQCDYYQ